MDMTLDYNTELFPLAEGQNFAMALASSLARDGGGPAGADGTDAEDKDRDIWRPDGKGRRGLEEDYDYVMYGKVSYLLVTKVLEMNEGCCFRSTNSMVGLLKSCKASLLSCSPRGVTCWYDSTAYASFGGLLLSLTGSFRHMANVVLGDPVYILLRR